MTWVSSGLSGAGKSQASKLFEDLGYSCVDNLPPELLREFLQVEQERTEQIKRLPGGPGRAISLAAESD